MRVLVTGHEGYIGVVMVPLLRAAGHQVVGLDSGIFAGCTLGPEPEPVSSIPVDVRDVQRSHLEGFDAVIHLAGISNDPVGSLDPGLTYEVNHDASVRLARLARDAGVPRFLFSSSCSLYGAAGEDDVLTEAAAFNPVTAYGESKAFVERDVAPLATDDFSPTFLRNATVYGMSPRLRADLVVNNLTAWAFTTGRILIQSDGTPWRPLVHVADVAAAFLAVLEAPREVVHGQAFNVGRDEENYRVREVADMVADAVPGSAVEFAPGGGPDTRCYRVDFSKLVRTFPELRLERDVASGVRELVDSFARYGFSFEDLDGDRFTRLAHVRVLRERGMLDGRLRWVGDVPADAVRRPSTVIGARGSDGSDA
jgi:nucleoside-diphosphate-sugar epimerase